MPTDLIGVPIPGGLTFSAICISQIIDLGNGKRSCNYRPVKAR